MSRSDIILVVDDEDAGRFVKSQTLRRAGFTVIESSNGADALEHAAADRPDLVVLDVNLPDISGLEVCRRLRVSTDGQTGLQIMQISNTAVAPADQVRGLEHGADVYLVEPIESSVLVATARALLRARHAEVARAEALENERHARELAEQAGRLKDEFIATLSHELRTPLNALMGWIWQLRHTRLDDNARDRALDSVERNARMQAQLINDLLDVSRASKGKLQLEMRLINLKDVVEDAVEIIRESIEHKPLDLQVKLRSVWVAGDQARLHQVIGNLLTNAIQFTPAHKSIVVSLFTEGDDAVVTVQDSGAGIDPAFLPYVFDQFRQGEGGLSRKHGGLGLGLTVVKQLIDLHGGTVNVSSEGAGRGATFTVRLPREEVHGTAAGAEGGALLLQDVKVLLATEDEQSAVAGIRGALESAGARVTLAPSTDVSDDEVAAANVDVAIIDRGESAPVTLRFVGSAPAIAIPPIPVPMRGSNIVRRVARGLALSRAS